jgi:hypothetical protein
VPKHPGVGPGTEGSLPRAVIALTCAAAIGAAFLVPATSADAHTLLPSEAANSAWLAADDWGESREWRFGDLVDVNVARSDCHRRSRHVRSYDAMVEFEKEVQERECD